MIAFGTEISVSPLAVAVIWRRSPLGLFGQFRNFVPFVRISVKQLYVEG
jgi:hypothetical protein